MAPGGRAGVGGNAAPTRVGDASPTHGGAAADAGAERGARQRTTPTAKQGAACRAGGRRQPVDRQPLLTAGARTAAPHGRRGASNARWDARGGDGQRVCVSELLNVSAEEKTIVGAVCVAEHVQTPPPLGIPSTGGARTEPCGGGRLTRCLGQWAKWALHRRSAAAK